MGVIGSMRNMGELKAMGVLRIFRLATTTVGWRLASTFLNVDRRPSTD